MPDAVDPRRRKFMLAPFRERGDDRRGETHLSSLVVHALPDRRDAAAAAIARMPGAEVHGSHPNGKMIVTLETKDESEIVTAMNVMHEVPGVLSVALVFHHVESV